MEHKKLIISLIILIFILLLSVIGGTYFILQNQKPHTEEIVKEKEPEKNEGIMFKSEMKDLIFNITNDKNKEKMFKLSFVLGSSNPQLEQIVEKYRRDIIDITITLLSSKNSNELLTIAGKNLLKEELIKEINIVLNNVIPNEKELKMENNMIKVIYFSDFIIK